MRRLMIAVTLILLSVIHHHPAHAQVVLSGGFYDDTVLAIQYSGEWTNFADSNAFMGSRKSTGVVTSIDFSIEFNVWGDGFVLYTMRTTTGGTADVCVNSICSSLSFYAPSLTYTTVLYSGYGYGIHNVTITKTSTFASFITLDAVQVLPPAPAPTVIPPTPIVVVTLIMPTPADTQVFNVGNWDEATIEVVAEQTEDPIRTSWDVDGQDVAFEYRIDTGQVVMTIIQIIMLFIALIILVLFLRGKQAS